VTERIFTSGFWTELFKLLKTNLKLSSAYHPQTDGQTKHMNQCLEMFLRCSVQETPKQWAKWLPLAELWYNTSFHSSLKCSPFKALYVVEASPGIIPTLKHSNHQDVSNILKERQLFNEMLREQLQKAQNRMKLYDDAKRSVRAFQVGDKVLLKLQPYTQGSVVSRPYPKLAFKYFGSYTVLEKMGSVAYKI
jgi:ribosomal protein L21E